jgi:hypothetical protein
MGEEEAARGSAWNWTVLGLLSLTGAMMGVILAFGGSFDTLWVEFVYWTLLAVAWVWLVLRFAPRRVFWHLVLIGVGSGLLLGATTQLLWDPYLENNQATVEQPAIDQGQDPDAAAFRATHFAIGVVIGALWGVLVGAFAVGIKHMMARRRMTPAP